MRGCCAPPDNVFTVIPEEPGKEDELVIETYEASTTAFETPRYSKNDKRISKKLESMEIEVTDRNTGKFGKNAPQASPSQSEVAGGQKMSPMVKSATSSDYFAFNNSGKIVEGTSEHGSAQKSPSSGSNFMFDSSR